jgi:acetoin utilization deacetylase AcuC-like enzyme
VCVFADAGLARYHFGPHHPCGPARYPAFIEALRASGLAARVGLRPSAMASEADLLLFHTPDYVASMRRQCAAGVGFLDLDDTPALPGLYEAAARVVGTTLAAVATNPTTSAGPGARWSRACSRPDGSAATVQTFLPPVDISAFTEIPD